MRIIPTCSLKSATFNSNRFHVLTFARISFTWSRWKLVLRHLAFPNLEITSKLHVTLNVLSTSDSKLRRALMRTSKISLEGNKDEREDCGWWRATFNVSIMDHVASRSVQGERNEMNLQTERSARNAGNVKIFTIASFYSHDEEPRKAQKQKSSHCCFLFTSKSSRMVLGEQGERDTKVTQ